MHFARKKLERTVSNGIRLNVVRKTILQKSCIGRYHIDNNIKVLREDSADHLEEEDTMVKYPSYKEGMTQISD